MIPSSRWAIICAMMLALPVRPFDCSFEADSIAYDLNPIGGFRSAFKENETPPTTSKAGVRMDICSGEGLPEEDGASDEDQCGEGTKVCLTLSNHKESAADPDRITAVIPLWHTDTPDEDVTVTALGRNGEDGVRIYVAGPEYSGLQQYLNLTLHCDPSGTDSDPTFISYSGNLLSLYWATPDACPRSGEGAVEPITKGVGFFGVLKFLFWMAILGLILYFGIGIFYNHQQYSAKGWDLVPHRDFWREFPVLVQDLFSHILAGFRGQHGGGGRGGYSSLG